MKEGEKIPVCITSGSEEKQVVVKEDLAGQFTCELRCSERVENKIAYLESDSMKKQLKLCRNLWEDNLVLEGDNARETTHFYVPHTPVSKKTNNVVVEGDDKGFLSKRKMM